jgi:hypothetical protein
VQQKALPSPIPLHLLTHLGRSEHALSSQCTKARFSAPTSLFSAAPSRPVNSVRSTHREYHAPRATHTCTHAHMHTFIHTRHTYTRTFMLPLDSSDFMPSRKEDMLSALLVLLPPLAAGASEAAKIVPAAFTAATSTTTTRTRHCKSQSTAACCTQYACMHQPLHSGRVTPCSVSTDCTGFTRNRRTPTPVWHSTSVENGVPNNTFGGGSVVQKNRKEMTTR